MKIIFQLCSKNFRISTSILIRNFWILLENFGKSLEVLNMSNNLNGWSWLKIEKSHEKAQTTIIWYNLCVVILYETARPSMSILIIKSYQIQHETSYYVQEPQIYYGIQKYLITEMPLKKV